MRDEAMFPFRDHNPSNRVPYVAYALIAINVLVYLTYGFLPERQVYAIFDTWAMVPLEITFGQDLHTLLTCMFMHGGWMHLAGNMLFLWVFGDNLEDYLGHAGMVVFYLLCGLGASAAQIAVNPYSEIPNVGASGAIAGLMGGYLLLFPKARVDVLFIIVIIVKVVPLPAWLVLGAWVGLQVVMGAVDWGVGDAGVAYFAHIGGFIAGIAGIALIWTMRGRPRAWPEMPHAPVPVRNPWAVTKR